MKQLHLGRIVFWTVLFFSSAVPSRAFTRANFEAPESFVVDPDTGSYYVSNVNGGAVTKDGNGYISKISSSGNLVIQKFIGGKKENPILHAPKGLIVLGKQIWTTDIDSVKIFERATGKWVRTLEFQKYYPRFLNDLAVDAEGKVYVSDMFGDQILKIDPALDFKVSLFKSGKELGNPAGLKFNPRTKMLMVVTYKTGKLLEIDRLGRVHVLKKGLSTLDGIDYDNAGNFYISSFDKGEIYRIPNYGRGPLSVYLSGLTTPGDITVDRKKKEILIPSFRGHTVTTLFLAEPKKASER